jgi:murein DD-endopeptidase MepM/ murein hydrolase activator NlpD
MVTMKNGFQKFISGKGFYLALAICLAGAGAAAWVAVDKTIENIEQAPLAKTPQAQQEQAFSQPGGKNTTPSAEQDFSQPAGKNVENIKKEESEPAPSSDRLSAESSGDSSRATQDYQEGQVMAEAPSDESSTDVLSPSVPQTSSSTAPESSEASAQPSEVTPSAGFTLSLPVSGAAINPFSGDMLVKNETLHDWRTHNGIDISAALGDAVTSSCDGVVTDIRSDPMWGNVVEVTSGSYVLTYAGLGDDIPVSVDMPVSAGETIGSVGEIPCELSLEPHLHFDVKYNGSYVDPASLAE